MAHFNTGDYIEMTDPHFQYNRGIRAVVLGCEEGWVRFETTYVPETSTYTVGEMGNTTTDKWGLTDGPVPLTEADKKLAKIAELVRDIEAAAEYQHPSDEDWLKGNYYGSGEAARAVRKILEG